MFEKESGEDMNDNIERTDTETTPEEEQKEIIAAYQNGELLIDHATSRQTAILLPYMIALINRASEQMRDSAALAKRVEKARRDLQQIKESRPALLNEIFPLEERKTGSKPKQDNPPG